MIKITWLQLANPYFQQAVNTIWDTPMMDAHTSYSAHRVRTGMVSVEKDIRDLRLKLCDEYGKKDENGKLINDERGHIVFDSPEKNREFEEAFAREFNSRSLELKVSKIDFEKIVTVRGVTPRMWEYLEPIVSNLPKDEDEPAQEEPAKS